MALIGAHLRNQNQLTREDATRFASMKGECALAFWYQDPEEVARFVGPSFPSSVVVRLRDSIWEGRIPSDVELAADWQGAINRWASHGYTLFHFDNEPNPEWAGQSARAGQTVPGLWAWLLRRVLARLVLPPGVKLLLTPMSHPSLHKKWLDKCFVTEQGLPSIFRYCSGAAVHTYWQADDDMHSDWAGREYEYVHQRTGMELYITECACSSESDVEVKRQRDYLWYIGQVQPVSYIKHLDFYILGSDGWPTFEITDQVAAVIGERPMSHNIGGSGGNAPRTE